MMLEGSQTLHIYLLFSKENNITKCDINRNIGLFCRYLNCGKSHHSWP